MWTNKAGWLTTKPGHSTYDMADSWLLSNGAYAGNCCPSWNQDFAGFCRRWCSIPLGTWGASLFSRQSAGAIYISSDYQSVLLCCFDFFWGEDLISDCEDVGRLILTRRDRVKLSNSVYFHYSELCFSSIAAQARFAICKRRMGGPFVCHIAWKPMTSRWSSPSSLMHVSMPKPLKITFANLPKKMVRRWSVWAPRILRTFEDFKHLTWHVCQQLSYQAPAPPVIPVA